MPPLLLVTIIVGGFLLDWLAPLGLLSRLPLTPRGLIGMILLVLGIGLAATGRGALSCRWHQCQALSSRHRAGHLWRLRAPPQSHVCGLDHRASRACAAACAGLGADTSGAEPHRAPFRRGAARGALFGAEVRRAV